MSKIRRVGHRIKRQAGRLSRRLFGHRLSQDEIQNTLYQYYAGNKFDEYGIRYEEEPIEKVLLTLSKKQLDLVTMRFSDHRTIQEMAEATLMTPQGVSESLRTIYKSLQDKI